jgi:hypothetical protein
MLTLEQTREVSNRREVQNKREVVRLRIPLTMDIDEAGYWLKRADSLLPDCNVVPEFVDGDKQ